MIWENWFSLASTAAAAGWAALILLPRWPWLRLVLRYALPGALATAYTALVMVYFFHVEGGGFNSLAQVKALLATEPTLLAGWVHYLAFDLFIGAWITTEVLRLSLPRLVLVAVLPLTFLFGPIGLLALFAAKLALHGKEEHS